MRRKLRWPSGAFRGVPGPAVPVTYKTPRGWVRLVSSKSMGVERLSNPAWRDHVISKLESAGYAVKP